MHTAPISTWISTTLLSNEQTVQFRKPNIQPKFPSAAPKFLVENNQRAWSLTVIEDGARQYGGNQGYDDDISKNYRYDAAVANHKQLAQGDVVFIRGRTRVVGVAHITRIDAAPVDKIQQRCPVCNKTGIKRRKGKLPEWRCGNAHEFDRPNAETVHLMGYTAHYGNTFSAVQEELPAAALKAVALRSNPQLSIEELDIARLERMLHSQFSSTATLLRPLLSERTLLPFEALENHANEEPEIGVHEPYISGNSNTRETVMRTIKLRRGQRTFRDKLITRYGGQCVVTGCGLLDILEAAHIDPYVGGSTNHPENGLLLRADIHTLFDLNLMAIDPISFTVRFHPHALAAGYATYDKLPLKLSLSQRPALEPLKKRWASFQKRLALRTA